MCSLSCNWPTWELILIHNLSIENLIILHFCENENRFYIVNFSCQVLRPEKKCPFSSCQVWDLEQPGTNTPLQAPFAYMVFSLTVFSYADMTVWPVESFKKNLLQLWQLCSSFFQYCFLRPRLFRNIYDSCYLRYKQTHKYTHTHDFHLHI